jgi:hypothetical protein
MTTRVAVAVASSLLIAIGLAPNGRAQDQRPVSLFIVDVKGDGYRLTRAVDGVLFDIDLRGTKVRTAWTAAGSDDSFLVVDTNGNGRIDDAGEMLGDAWRMTDGARVATGFLSLVVIQGFAPDVIKGPVPQEARIASVDRNDEVFARLRLWTDGNHDGQSEPGELRSLAEADIAAIHLGFRQYTQPVPDPFGNTTLLAGLVTLVDRRPQQIRFEEPRPPSRPMNYIKLAR